jgi:hypothetical protein
MTKEEIIRMAREAGPLISTPFDVWCERFAALVAAVEQEACANVCEKTRFPDSYTAIRCAAAIRARGEG